MILSQKNIEEIAVAVIRDFQKSFFGSEADDPARFALPTPIDQFASDYLNLKVSFQKLSSDGSIYGLTAYVDTRGHVQTKCKACGRETVFNVLEMRRLRRLQLYYSSLNG